MGLYNTKVSIISYNANEASAANKIKQSNAIMKKCGFQTNKTGWLHLDLKDIYEVQINKVIEEAKKNDQIVRIIADIEVYDNNEYEWYMMNTEYMETTYKRIPPDCNYGVKVAEAYKNEMGIYAVGSYDNPEFVIRQDVRNDLKKVGISCDSERWFPDVGRFKSEQFYYWDIKDYINCISGVKEGKVWQSITMNKLKAIDYLKYFEPKLEIIAKNHPDNVRLEELTTPFVIEEKELCGKKFAICSDCSLIVNKTIKDTLVDKKYMSYSLFEPVIVVSNYSDMFSKGIMFKNRIKYDNSNREPSESDLLKENFRHKLYIKYLKEQKPEKKTTLKMALERLEVLKAKNPEKFNKGADSKELNSFSRDILKPYFKFSNGFNIEFEYDIFSLSECEEFKAEFERDRQFELENGPGLDVHVDNSNLKNSDYQADIGDSYTVFGKTSDGDWILLLRNGNVVRYSLFSPDFVETWNSIHEFFCFAKGD